MSDVEEQLDDDTVISPEDIKIEPPLDNIDGVKPEVAKKIEKMLQQGRRYFGSSGAYFTYQAFDPEYTEREEINKELAKNFVEGERDTTTILKKWLKDKPGAVLVDSIHVPETDEETEDEFNKDLGLLERYATSHIVLIGSEVILIDTRRWKKKKNYSVGDYGEALMTNKEFEGSNIVMQENIQEWLEYLDEDASLTGIICINSEETTVLRNRNWYTKTFRLVEIDRFIELLDEKYKLIDDYDKTTINSTLVSQVIVRCIKPFDQYSRVFDMKTLQTFK